MIDQLSLHEPGPFLKFGSPERPSSQTLGDEKLAIGMENPYSSPRRCRCCRA